MITQSLRRFNLCTIEKPDKSRAFLQKQRSEAYFHIRQHVENFLREYLSATPPRKTKSKTAEDMPQSSSPTTISRRRLHGDVPYQRKLSQRRTEQSYALSSRGNPRRNLVLRKSLFPYEKVPILIGTLAEKKRFELLNGF